MGFRSFLSSCSRLIKLIGRPKTDDLWASIRISLVGLAILGVLGFIIKFIATMLQAAPPSV
ncbi:MAG: preprotein translocase subunit SecE [Candidatus Bathyarchaeota archaeon]|nr:MAG: preprotein translocase subunit SecE [Candidatus Bathyarchaeota archaeon]